MHILIVNWRSIKDPLSGGAEVATFEHAKRWVENHNAKVTWLSPIYNKNIKSEVIEGINFQYIGLPLDRNIKKLIFTFPYFYFLVFVTYMTKFRGKVDVFIDQAHGFPYLTPLYVKEKKIVYIHEVAGDIWDKMYAFPLNLIGKYTERLIYRLYKKIHFVTVSNGTKLDLLKLKIPDNNISVVYNGISAPLVTAQESIDAKEKQLTIMYLNRLVKMKGIERAIDIFAKIKTQNAEAKFWIIGAGEEDYVQFLHQKCIDLQIDKNVVFYGYVSSEQKFDLLKKSHWLINPSYKEGWGLVNIEANSQGTPAIAFNVQGNTESIVNDVSGYLENTNEQIIKKILSTNITPEFISKCIQYSQKFNWERQSDEFYKASVTAYPNRQNTNS